MREHEDEKRKGGGVRLLLIGACAGLLLTVICLAVFAGMISSGVIPESAAWMCAPLACFLGVSFGSMVTAGAWKQHILLNGLGIGVCAFLVLFCAGLFFSFPPKGNAVAPLAACLLGGITGTLPKLLGGRRHRRGAK